MTPRVWLAGSLLAIGAAGVAHGQTSMPQTSAPLTASLLQTPLTLPSNLGSSSFVSATTAKADGSVVRRDVTESQRRAGARAVDTLRITVTESAMTPGGFPSLMISPDQARDRSMEMDYSRAWPGAVSSAAGSYLIEMTPEARFGYGAAGGSIGGGATVTVMSPKNDAKVVERLAKMGVGDGASYGNQGRWYLFAAASGRAVGFNMVPGANNGWSTDPTALVADGQIGVGWRKGDIQTSIGYMMRDVDVDDRYAHQVADVPGSDQVIGLSFSYRPRPR